ncbi:MAG: DUF86 domain-containing protein [Candidatus Nanopelagicales bacterium]
MRVQRLLRQAADVADFLDAEASASDEVRAQRRWLDSVKYNFIVAIECCVDVGQHLCAVQGWGPPASNADTFRILAVHCVVTQDLADQMARASGFRNILVHEYVAVRDDVVVSNLGRTSDIRAFVTEIARWLG